MLAVFKQTVNNCSKEEQSKLMLVTMWIEKINEIS